MGEQHKVIQWFPGHMAKTKRKIIESLKLVDAVAEIRDARIPISSENPDILEITANKPRIILLNKSDLADNAITEKWINYYAEKGVKAIAFDCKGKNGIKNFNLGLKEVLKEKIEKNKQKGIKKALRIMVVGIPNVGKSSFINLLADKKAKVENRPGVTRGNQWFSAGDDLLLLDTPGVLWPKFEDETVGMHLAFTGAVKESILNTEEIAFYLIKFLLTDNTYKEMLEKRYSLTFNSDDDAYDIICRIGAKRGMLVKGGETDTERASKMIADEFKSGIIGKISIEEPKV